MGRVGREDTEKAESRWLFSDLGFKAEDVVRKVESKYRGNPGVRRVQAITLKSDGAEPEQSI